MTPRYVPGSKILLWGQYLATVQQTAWTVNSQGTKAIRRYQVSFTHPEDGPLTRWVYLDELAKW